ncbi:hypothetical protein [Pseudidiomarina sp. CB1]|uniref:hypothetical protein n=1 Tax=Pseudidiomarina sp. CB1 TaxID=2972484 RepID=UPI0021631055|nr:hypothetical protein [Pseudidiomarina sp. CB1]
MLNLFRARNNSNYCVTFALRKASLHMVVLEGRDNDKPSLVVCDDVTVTDGDYTTALRKLAHSYAKYCRHNPPVGLVLGIDFYQSVSLDRPDLEPAELAASLRYSLRDLVSYEPDDCIADYYELPIKKAGQNKINAIAASKTELAPLIQTLHEISDNVVAVLSEEQAIAEMFTASEEPTVVAYQQAEQAALLQVYRGGELQVNRAVRALEQLHTLTLDEVRMGGLQPLSVEVQRSGDYFERQLRQSPIRQVTLALTLPKQDEVLASLHEDLGLPVAWASYPAWAQELAVGDYSDFAALGGAVATLKLWEGKR